MKDKPKLFLVDNAYLLKDNAGNYYSAGIYDNDFFWRYQKVFGKIKFMAKIRDIGRDTDAVRERKISTEYIEIIELPPFQGICGLLKMFPGVLEIVQKAADESDCFILRMLQFESVLCWFCRKHKPYAVEVVNDPMGSKRYPRLINLVLTALHQTIIHRAGTVSYVTKRILQKKYPYKGSGMTSWYSSIELPDDFIMRPKNYQFPLTVIRIAHAANMIVGNSKGHYTLVRVIKRIIDAGGSAECFFYGEGASVPELKRLCKKLGILHAVHFMGYVNEKKELMLAIRKCDLFVFPSETEGMPRCLIEACAAGMPCLASGVGGIPELLQAKYRIPYENDKQYAQEILRLSKDPAELSEMSRNNVKTARGFCKSRMDQKRTEFYMNFKKVTLS